MLFALLLLASVADWVPMRWPWAEPKSLQLIADSPINCLLLERSNWNQPVVPAAAAKDIITLGIVHAGGSAVESVQSAARSKLTGIVLQGDFDAAERKRLEDAAATAKLVVLQLPSRAKMRIEDDLAMVGTFQGVWPGIHEEENAEAAPSGAPWIHTNSGFLRFVRSLTPAPVWIAQEPPAKQVLTGTHYQQAIADAALAGARWVLALDPEYAKLLDAGNSATLQEWRKILHLLSFLEQNRDWRKTEPVGELALLQDTNTGALFSGGILDMLAVKHTPVRLVPSRKLSSDALTKATMAVNVVPSALNDQQKESLRAFTRRGGTILSGPPSWQFPAITPDRVTLKHEETQFLDETWRELNAMTGRRNLGARLFNVSSMLSSMGKSADGKGVILQLVNYSGYPVESVTVHLLGEFKKATLLKPGAEPAKLETYGIEEGTGVEIPTAETFATLIVE
jgi:hypothetical protein